MAVTTGIRWFGAAVGLGVALVACGPAEVRVDEKQGIPSIKGSTEVALGSYTCGQPLTAGDFTVTTTAVDGGCGFFFDKDVPLLKTTDYQGIPELQGASNLVQRVELTIKTLAFADAATGTKLDVNTAITTAKLVVNGQTVADKSALSQLPKTVSLSGDALTQLKTKVDARAAAGVHVLVDVVLPDSPKPPARLKIDYDAQPALILGTTGIKL